MYYRYQILSLSDLEILLIGILRVLEKIIDKILFW